METAAENKKNLGRSLKRLNLSASGWAFEFLRRNQEFRNAVACTQSQTNSRDLGGGAFLLDSLSKNALDRFAVLYCNRVDHSIDQAQVVWRPEDNNDVIDVRIVPSMNEDVAGAMLKLHSIICEKFILTTPGYPIQICLQDGAKQLQLSCVDGSPIEDGDAAIIPLVSPNRNIERQLLNMRRLFNLYSDGEFPENLFKPDPKSLRLSEVLTAYDLWRANASMRDIATAIYDTAIVEEDWSPEGGYLIDRVRRLIRRGRHLVKSGFRSLLP